MTTQRLITFIVMWFLFYGYAYHLDKKRDFPLYQITLTVVIIILGCMIS